MRKSIFTILIAATIIVFSMSSPASAQFQGGLNFDLGFPQGEFGEQVDKTGYGLSGHFAFTFPGSFVSIGATGGGIIYGKEKRREPFSTTIPDVTVMVETSNTLINGHLFLRIQPPVGPVRPYLDGLFGFNHLRTDTEIKDEDLTDSEVIASSNNFKDTVLSYGIGGGVMFRIFSTPTRAGGLGKGVSVFLDIGAKYLKGGTANYLKEGSIKRSPGGDVVYEVTESETDIVLGHIGITVAF